MAGCSLVQPAPASSFGIQSRRCAQCAGYNARRRARLRSAEQVAGQAAKPAGAGGAERPAGCAHPAGYNHNPCRFPLRGFLQPTAQLYGQNEPASIGRKHQFHRGSVRRRCGAGSPAARSFHAQPPVPQFTSGTRVADYLPAHGQHGHPGAGSFCRADG